MSLFDINGALRSLLNKAACIVVLLIGVLRAGLQYRQQQALFAGR